MFVQSDGFSGHCGSLCKQPRLNIGTMKTVFVTVGTTSFDDLVVSLTSDEVVEVVSAELV